MAITQPTYPSRTDDLVTHVGAYVNAQDDLRISHNIFNGTSFPARPTATVVFWIGGEGADDPTADMDDGDVWFPSGA